MTKLQNSIGNPASSRNKGYTNFWDTQFNLILVFFSITSFVCAWVHVMCARTWVNAYIHTSVSQRTMLFVFVCYPSYFWGKFSHCLGALGSALPRPTPSVGLQLCWAQPLPCIWCGVQVPMATQQGLSLWGVTAAPRLFFHKDFSLQKWWVPCCETPISTLQFFRDL